MTDSIKTTKILIGDDEALVAMDLEARLKQLGYTICGRAGTAEKALELVEQHLPYLVMMDIVLKGKMDGIDAAEVIRDKWGIPVIFLTAYADTDRLSFRVSHETVPRPGFEDCHRNGPVCGEC